LKRCNPPPSGLGLELLFHRRESQIVEGALPVAASLALTSLLCSSRIGRGLFRARQQACAGTDVSTAGDDPNPTVRRACIPESIPESRDCPGAFRRRRRRNSPPSATSVYSTREEGQCYEPNRYLRSGDIRTGVLACTGRSNRPHLGWQRARRKGRRRGVVYPHSGACGPYWRLPTRLPASPGHHPRDLGMTAARLSKTP
jgi:hypothetical protein